MKDLVILQDVGDPKLLPLEYWEEITCLKASDEVLFYDSGIHWKRNVTINDLLKECDRLVMVWNGNNQVAFMYIMLQLALNKPCRMFYSPLKMWFDVDSIGSIERFVNPRPFWSEEEEMKLVNIVCGSSFTDQEKVYVLGDLAERNNYIFELYQLVMDMIAKCANYDDLRKAILKYESYPYLEFQVRKIMFALADRRNKGDIV